MGSEEKKETRESASGENNAPRTCKLLRARKEMWGVWLLLLWVPTLLMSLSGPVRAAGAARVPSRPQTAVIRPVMACHRARLAWHSGEISNIHLLPLHQRLKQRFCRAFGVHLTSRSRKAQQLYCCGKRKHLIKWNKKTEAILEKKGQCGVKVRLSSDVLLNYCQTWARCLLPSRLLSKEIQTTEKCLGKGVNGDQGVSQLCWVKKNGSSLASCWERVWTYAFLETVGLSLPLTLLWAALPGRTVRLSLGATCNLVFTFRFAEATRTRTHTKKWFGDDQLNTSKCASVARSCGFSFFIV